MSRQTALSGSFSIRLNQNSARPRVFFSEGKETASVHGNLFPVSRAQLDAHFSVSSEPLPAGYCDIFTDTLYYRVPWDIAIITFGYRNERLNSRRNGKYPKILQNFNSNVAAEPDSVRCRTSLSFLERPRHISDFSSGPRFGFCSRNIFGIIRKASYAWKESES